MEKIEIDKIRGRWMDSQKDGFFAAGDDTIKSIQMVAEKVNELIDFLATPLKEEPK